MSVPPISTVLLAAIKQAPPPIIDDPSKAVLLMGSHFAPHTAISITAHGVSGALATTYADAAGSFALPLTVHDKLIPGSYTLIATGRNPAGKAMSLSVAVTGHHPAPSVSHSGMPVVLVIVALLAALIVAAASLALWRRRKAWALAGRCVANERITAEE